MNNIKVVEIIKSPFCVSTEDADILYNIIKEKLSLSENVVVSFEGYILLTTAFFNIGIGRLYGQFDYNFVDRHLLVKDLSEDDSMLVSIWIKRAKQYFEDPEYYDELLRKCMAE